jgi:hypothetical protein
MAANTLRKIVPAHPEPSVANPTERKPPQSELEVDARSRKKAEPTQSTGAAKVSIPATWSEAIQDPQVWAEVRPLLVDED